MNARGLVLSDEVLGTEDLGELCFEARRRELGAVELPQFMLKPYLAKPAARAEVHVKYVPSLRLFV